MITGILSNEWDRGNNGNNNNDNNNKNGNKSNRLWYKEMNYWKFYSLACAAPSRINQQSETGNDMSNVSNLNIGNNNRNNNNDKMIMVQIIE